MITENASASLELSALLSQITDYKACARHFVWVRACWLTTIDISPHQLCRMSPFSRIKLRVSRRDRASGNPENRVKRRHRIKATIETKHVLVEVGLQVLRLNAAMM